MSNFVFATLMGSCYSVVYQTDAVWTAAQHRFHPTPLRGLLAAGKRAFR
jgi:hypothetical protein